VFLTKLLINNMKKLILFAAIAAFASCSDDDCAGKRDQINAEYQEQIDLYEGDEARQQLIRERRDRALANAC